MTEEERQKTLLELEQQVLGAKPWNGETNKRTKKTASRYTNKINNE